MCMMFCVEEEAQGEQVEDLILSNEQPLKINFLFFCYINALDTTFS